MCLESVCRTPLRVRAVTSLLTNTHCRVLSVREQCDECRGYRYSVFIDRSVHCGLCGFSTLVEKYSKYRKAQGRNRYWLWLR
jgi:hypothetical protein